MNDPDQRILQDSDSLLNLAADELHLWLCHQDAAASSDQFCREVLSRYAPLAPAQWHFTSGPRGKPAIVNAPRPLAFNLSDSGDWRACAVTGGSAVGVDIEYCNPGRDLMRLARRFFRPEEARALGQAPEEEKVARFYAYWTLKEARVKRRGDALASSLAEAGFGLQGGCARDSSGPGRIEERHPDAAKPAHFILLQPAPEYRLALCWLPEAGTGTRLHVFYWPGNGAEKAPQPVLLAYSHPVSLEPSLR